LNFVESIRVVVFDQELNIQIFVSSTKGIHVLNIIHLPYDSSCDNNYTVFHSFLIFIYLAFSSLCFDCYLSSFETYIIVS